MRDDRSHDKRILELDVLRGLAALSVLCYHYTSNYFSHYSASYPMPFECSRGYYGVFLFFMISGFVIFMSLEKTKGPVDFIVSRFSRLYPVYWTAILLTFTLVSYCHLPGKEATVQDALVNLTMFQRWFDTKNVDPVYWTLTVELSFYIVMLIVFIQKGLKHIESWGLMWLVFMIFSSRIWWYGHIHMPLILRDSNLLIYGHLFFAGILFYHLKTKGHSWTRHVSLALCLATGYLVRVSSLDIYYEIGFFIIFYLFVYGYLSWIISRPLLFLGAISYSLYLIHDNIGFIVIRYLYSLKASPWLLFTVPTILSILLAALMTYLIEKPANKWIKFGYAKAKN